MIPVAPKPEPTGFDADVRRKGQTWLRTKGIPPASNLPKGTKLNPYWRKYLPQLHASYEGVCAYLCVYLELEAGGVSADHHVAKSRRAGLAYEWSNYRLACSTMNGRKSDFETVLDPFLLAPDTFHLELVTGRIYPNPSLTAAARLPAQDTIDRLRLDGAGAREMRARHYEEYRSRVYDESFLKKRSPFVWLEAQRQGLL